MLVFTVVVAVGLRPPQIQRKVEVTRVKHHRAICSYRDIVIFFLKKNFGLLQIFSDFPGFEEVNSDHFCHFSCYFYGGEKFQ